MPAGLNKIRNSVEAFGPWMTLLDLALYGASLVHGGAGTLKHILTDRAFDRRWGTDTAGQLLPDEFEGVDPDAKRKAVRYRTLPARVVRFVVDSLELDLREFVFVDVGSGKGRVLLLASEYPFREIIGLEIVPGLCDVANRNVAHYRSANRQCQRVSIRCEDAREFEMPERPLVLYLYHPFQAASGVLRTVLQNLSDSASRSPRPIRLIYLYHLHDAVGRTFDEFPFLEIQRVHEFVDPFLRTVIYSNRLG